MFTWLSVSTRLYMILERFQTSCFIFFVHHDQLRPSYVIVINELKLVSCLRNYKIGPFLNLVFRVSDLKNNIMVLCLLDCIHIHLVHIIPLYIHISGSLVKYIMVVDTTEEPHCKKSFLLLLKIV